MADGFLAEAGFNFGSGTEDGQLVFGIFAVSGERAVERARGRQFAQQHTFALGFVQRGEVFQAGSCKELGYHVDMFLGVLAQI